jgi:hypothetical protein
MSNRPPKLAPELWAQFRSSIAGTTSMEDGGPQVIAWGDGVMAERLRKAAGGRAVAQRKHEEVRDKIIAAAGAMGLVVTLKGWSATLQRRIRRTGPKVYGLDRTPDLRTINKARHYLLANSTTLPSCTPLLSCSLNTTSSTT